MRIMEGVMVDMDVLSLIQEFNVNTNNVVFGGVVGSRGFHLEDDFSDIDIHTYVMPTIHELIYNRRRHNFFMKNNMEIYFDDVRRIVYNLQLGNISQIAVLFCRDLYTNPKFKTLCDYLIKNREQISQVNLPAMFTWSKNLFEKDMGWLQTYKTDELCYQQFGYNCKRAFQAIYPIVVMTRYIINLHYRVKNPLETALNCSDIKEDLLKIKRGEYSLEEINKLADSKYQIFSQSKMPWSHGDIKVEEVQRQVEQEIIKFIQN